MKIISYLVLFISSILLLWFSSCNNDVNYDMSFDILNSATGYEYKIDISYPNSETTGHALFVLDPADMVPLVNEIIKEEGIGANVAIVGIGFNGKNERNRLLPMR